MITSSKYKKNNIEDSCKHEELVAFEEKEFLKERLSRKLELKLLTTETYNCEDYKKLDKDLLRETRFLPDKF